MLKRVKFDWYKQIDLIARAKCGKLINKISIYHYAQSLAYTKAHMLAR